MQTPSGCEQLQRAYLSVWNRVGSPRRRSNFLIPAFDDSGFSKESLSQNECYSAFKHVRAMRPVLGSGF